MTGTHKIVLFFSHFNGYTLDTLLLDLFSLSLDKNRDLIKCPGVTKYTKYAWNTFLKKIIFFVLPRDNWKQELLQTFTIFFELTNSFFMNKIIMTAKRKSKSMQKTLFWEFHFSALPRDNWKLGIALDICQFYITLSLLKLTNTFFIIQIIQS